MSSCSPRRNNAHPRPSSCSSPRTRTPTFAIKAINDIGLDYYLLKPWDPPEEKLYPVLDDLLSDWRGAHPEDSGVRVVGHKWSAGSHEIKTFLGRNYIPYRWLDLERDEEARRIHEREHAQAADLPLVLIPDRNTLRAPSTSDLARALDLRTSGRSRCTSCASWVAARPASPPRSMAHPRVWAPSWSKRTLPAARPARAPGSRTTWASHRGSTGVELAQRAVDQARRLKAEMVLPREVVGLDTRGPVRVVRFADGSEIEAWTVLIATGVSYRLLDAPGLAELAGRGVYYGASASRRPCV